MHSNDLKFSDILSCSVHDMSNSLGIITSVLENTHSINFTAASGSAVQASVEDLLYETARIHTDILQIYELYQIENKLYHINMAKHNVSAFIKEQLATNSCLLHAQHIALEVNGTTDLHWTFDANLLQGLLHNCIAKVCRYTDSKIVLHYGIDDGYLTITLEDDSAQGYPAHSFVTKADCAHGFELPSGSPGLSLYYLLRITQLHTNGSKSGYITVDNDGMLKGGRLAIHLP